MNTPLRSMVFFAIYTPQGTLLVLRGAASPLEGRSGTSVVID